MLNLKLLLSSLLVLSMVSCKSSFVQLDEQETDEATQFLQMLWEEDETPSPYMEGNPILCSMVLVLPAEEEPQMVAQEVEKETSILDKISFELIVLMLALIIIITTITNRRL